jgi:hypothetical protein
MSRLLASPRFNGVGRDLDSGAKVQIAISSTPVLRESQGQSHLLFWTIYLICFAAQTLRLIIVRITSGRVSANAPFHSVFTEANEEASIAASYTLMAQSLLRHACRGRNAGRDS